MRTLLEVSLYFFIYAFLGWVCESIYCSIGNNKIINRGFLNGPICPVYGFGALIVIFFLDNHQDSIIEIFMYGLILTSILEYTTGYLLETIFNTTWWDYSDEKYNLKGRVCIKNSILFGLMSVILMEVIHKIILNLVASIPLLLIIFLVASSIVLLVIDLSFTVISMNKLNTKLKSLECIIKELKNINIHLDQFDDVNLNHLFDILKNKGDLKSEKVDDIINKILNIRLKSTNQRRIIKAFPNMKHKHHHDILLNLKQIIKKKGNMNK